VHPPAPVTIKEMLCCNDFSFFFSWPVASGSPLFGQTRRPEPLTGLIEDSWYRLIYRECVNEHYYHLLKI